jgi:hypothetical protein
MRFLLLTGLAAGACFAQEIAVKVDGRPFTVFNYGKDAGKPFLAPVRSASGKIITRRFPMEKVEGESRDHLHHRGLWFSYDDVNGIKFWENEPSYDKPHMGRQVVRSAQLKEGAQSSMLPAVIEWRDDKGKVLMVENRDMVFAGDTKLRTIDFHITLTAAVHVTLGDTKEGAFAIRLDDAFTERKGLKILDADGRTKMANVWGKRSNWVDYSGQLDGEQMGVAIFDHPGNPRHPTYWHARDYGLFALNPFGRNAFDPKQEESDWKVPAGQKLEFRWRVLIHPGDAQSSRVAELYDEYAAKR